MYLRKKLELKLWCLFIKSMSRSDCNCQCVDAGGLDKTFRFIGLRILTYLLNLAKLCDITEFGFNVRIVPAGDLYNFRCNSHIFFKRFFARVDHNRIETGIET